MKCNHRPTFREFRKDISELEEGNVRIRFVCKCCGESIYLDDAAIQKAKKLHQLKKTFLFSRALIIILGGLMATFIGAWALLPTGGLFLLFRFSITLFQYISFRRMVFHTKEQNTRRQGDGSPVSFPNQNSTD